MSLYRKYRPQTFSDLIGQDQVKIPLLTQLQSGKFTHAYLFSGPRGTGKTTTARLFAKALNCKIYKDNKFGEPCNKCENCLAIAEGSYLDVLEIDAASNRGIDEIRDLREKIRLAPTVGKYKVYIIDEVHMLTNEAFNALLKTLEEPPEHAIFILATTELHKVPATIQSRTQKFEFVRPKKEHIKEKLSKISKEEKWTIHPEGLDEIAKVADGTFRDAEVLLDKISSVNQKASREEVQNLLGQKESKQIVEAINLLMNKKTREAVLWVGEFVEAGGDVKVLVEDFLEVLRNILMIKVGALEKNTIYSQEVFENLKSFSQQINKDKLTNWIKLFNESLVELKDSPIPQLPLELAIIEACEFNDEVTVEVKTIEQTNTTETKIVIEPEVAEDLIKESQESAPVEEEKPKKTKIVKSDSLVDTKVVKSDGDKKLVMEDLQKFWLNILENVKSKNSSLAVFLKSATPTSLDDDGLLTLEVGYRFHKDRLEEPKNSLLLSTTIEAILGRPVRIKGVVGTPKPRITKEDHLDEADPVEIFGKLN